MKLFVFLLLNLFIFWLFLPSSVFAAGLVPCGSAGQADCTFCHFFQLISNIMTFIAFKLAPPVAAFMFLIGGLYILTAGGDEGKVKIGKGIFTQAVVGLVIIFASFLIINTLIMVLAQGTGDFVPETWYRFKCG